MEMIFVGNFSVYQLESEIWTWDDEFLFALLGGIGSLYDVRLVRIQIKMPLLYIE